MRLLQNCSCFYGRMPTFIAFSCRESIFAARWRFHERRMHRSIALSGTALRCADRERCNLDAYWSGKPNRQRERDTHHTAARLAPLRPIVSHNLSYLSFSFFSRSPLPGQRAFLCLKFGSRSHKRRQGRSGNRFSSVWREVGSYFLLTELSIFLS